MNASASSTRRRTSARRRALAPQAERGVVPHRQPGKAGVLLEHDADAVGDLAGDGLPLERHRAGGRLLQTGEHFEEGRLAAARRPDHGEELALVEIDVDRAERVHRRMTAGAGINPRHAGELRMNVAVHGLPPYFCRSLGRNDVSIILLRSSGLSIMPTYFIARSVVCRRSISILPSLQNLAATSSCTIAAT